MGDATSATTVNPPQATTSAFDQFVNNRHTFALFLISVLGLFLELLMIRWISTEIRIFAYLQNCVLVVCFLGVGMGCWDSRKPFALRDVLLPLGALVLILAFPLSRVIVGEISTMLGGFQDFVIWQPTFNEGVMVYLRPFAGLIFTFGLMILLWATFVPIGRLLGRLMNEHPNTVWAYSVNVAGSLVGIWLFVLASALYFPPVVWFAMFALLATMFAGSGGNTRRSDFVLLGTILVFATVAGYEPAYDEARWTPYQKLSIRDQSKGRPAPNSLFERWWYGERGGFTNAPGQIFIAVNNTGYQATIDLRPTTVAANPEKYPPAQRGFSQYDFPAKLHPNPKRGLVVGAGSGNDAAGMLRNNLEHVVAVEIDPGIIDVGRKLHVENPYQDPRCVVVNDDARSYFATTSEKFDVISFGLLDSHTTTAMTNARLDHYVYTLESFARAKELLNPGGVMVLCFEAQKPYIADRMDRALEHVFGHKAMKFRIASNAYGWGGLMFAIGGTPGAIESQIAADPQLAKIVAESQGRIMKDESKTSPLTTDDWPYVYLEEPMIPILYYLLAGILVLLFLFGVRQLGLASTIKQWDNSSWHFFFLGAAFMLLEVQNVSKAAVVLGNTWAVNAVIISGVMVMILLANLLVAKFSRLPLPPVYALLVLSCIGLYFLDLSRFAFLPYATKALVVGLLTSVPMLFSGIVFIRSFAVTERKDTALGANLIGALVGGLLQSITFVTGIKALLLVVAALYLIAVLTRPRRAAVAAAVSA